MPRKHHKRCRRCHHKMHHLTPEAQQVIQEEAPIIQQEAEVINTEVEALQKGAQVILGAQLPPNTVGSPKIMPLGQANFSVPAGVTSLTIIAYGSGGDGGSSFGLPAIENGCGGGGGGGYIEVAIRVTPGDVFICNIGTNGRQTTVSGPQFSLTAFGGQQGGVGPDRKGGGQGAPLGLLSTGLPIINGPIRHPGTDGQPGSNGSRLRLPAIVGTGEGGQGGHAFNQVTPIQGFAFLSVGGAGGRESGNGFLGFGIGSGGGGCGGSLFKSGGHSSNGMIAFFW